MAFHRLFFAFILVVFYLSRPAFADEVKRYANDLFHQTDRSKSVDALSFFEKRSNLDSIAVLVLAMRYTGFANEAAEILKKITGEDYGGDWNRWMLWQDSRSWPSAVSVGLTPFASRWTLAVATSSIFVRMPIISRIRPAN